MQEEEKKTVDIDTSGPGAEVELPEEKKKRLLKNNQQRTKHMKTNVKQNLKTVVAPMTHLRNLYSSLIAKKIINKKITVNKLKSILKELKSE